MKKFFKFSIICFAVFMLSACGGSESEEDEEIQIVESEPLIVPDSDEEKMADKQEADKAEDAALKKQEADKDAVLETNADLFTGEYNDYDAGEQKAIIWNVFISK